jgi:TetR/AcrR family transcriptional regulator, transcriptional repressor for nem operon
MVNIGSLVLMPRTSDAKDRLLKAAFQLIWENSYTGVSVDEICARADARKGTFYHFFESKEALALETLKIQWVEFQRGMNDAFSPIIPPLERFERMHAFGMQEQREAYEKLGYVCGCPLLSLGTEIGTKGGPLQALLKEILIQQRKYYESAIRDALALGHIPPCDPVEKAEMLQNTILGALGLGRIMNSLTPIENILHYTHAVLGVKLVA